MRETALALALAFVAAGCDTGSPASPTFQSTPGVEDATVEGDAGATYVVCPTGIDASFGSIYGLMLSPPATCGSTNDSCHSTSGAMKLNALDFSLDAGGVYVELLGPDGGGQVSFNFYHPDVKVLRVAPGDAGGSMLYIKLVTTSLDDPNYGSGMPQNAPGSVCPATVEAVQDWINAGAAQN